MALIVQLSDLHMLSEEKEQQHILDALVRALEAECQKRSIGVDLVAITGDVFDSSTVDMSAAVRHFETFYDELISALGGHVPMVIVPGNHDRRRGGLIGPFRHDLFLRLRDALGAKAFIHGSAVPFLAQVAPNELHKLPLWLIAYDSTYLPDGLLSAGGMLRQEDLLQAASVIGDENPDWPVLFLLHHHLVPTPLTDVGAVEVVRTSRFVRWGVQRLLPSLVSNADREEMTMTALGAGTALSTLHALGRAVLVLHGHKHYATARLLSGTSQDQGDVLILGAGSAGLAQSWFPTTAKDAARLWPSFNVIELAEDTIAADVVSFGYHSDALGERAVRPLARASRRGPRWQNHPVAREGETGGPHRLDMNQLICRLSPTQGAPRWDCLCQRLYEGNSETAPEKFMDPVDALEDSSLFILDEHGNALGQALSPPTLLELHRAVLMRYRIDGGLPRTLSELRRLFGRRAPPFAWMGIMNRYESRRVRLQVSGGGSGALQGAFASETDLGTGLERPLRRSLGSTDDTVVIEYEVCPPRTLIRVYWPLEHD